MMKFCGVGALLLWSCFCSLWLNASAFVIPRVPLLSSTSASSKVVLTAKKKKRRNRNSGKGFGSVVPNDKKDLSPTDAGGDPIVLEEVKVELEIDNNLSSVVDPSETTTATLKEAEESPEKAQDDLSSSDATEPTMEEKPASSESDAMEVESSSSSSQNTRKMKTVPLKLVEGVPHTMGGLSSSPEPRSASSVTTGVRKEGGELPLQNAKKVKTVPLNLVEGVPMTNIDGSLESQVASKSATVGTEGQLPSQNTTNIKTVPLNLVEGVSPKASTSSSLKPRGNGEVKVAWPPF